MTAPDEVALTVRENVKRLRQERRWTQAELADRVERAIGTDFHGSKVNKIETGKRSVSIEEAVTLAEVLNVHITELLSPPANDDTVTVAAANAHMATEVWAREKHTSLIVRPRTYSVSMMVSEVDYYALLCIARMALMTWTWGRRNPGKSAVDHLTPTLPSV